MQRFYDRGREDVVKKLKSRRLRDDPWNEIGPLDSLTHQQSRKIAPIFTETLYGFVEEKYFESIKDSGARAELEAFLADFKENYMSQSPNFISMLPVEDELVYGSKFTRIPEAQAWIGQNITGETVYSMSFGFGAKDAERCAERFSSLPVPQILDILHYLQTVTANALASGDWAEGGYDLLVEIYQDLPRLGFERERDLAILEQSVQRVASALDLPIRPHMVVEEGQRVWRLE